MNADSRDHATENSTRLGTTFERQRRWLLMLSLVLAALSLRLFFFSGLANFDPQDDVVLLNTVNRINGPGICYEHYRGFDLEHLPNPVEHFPLRTLTVYPPALLVRLLCYSEFTITLWSLACSLGGVLAAFLLGRRLFNEQAGCAAALIVAASPLNIIFETRLLSEAPLGFFTALAGLLLIEGLEADSTRGRRRLAWLCAAGAAAGLAYLVKHTGAIIVPIRRGPVFLRRDRALFPQPAHLALALSLQAQYRADDADGRGRAPPVPLRELLTAHLHPPGAGPGRAPQGRQPVRPDLPVLHHLGRLPAAPDESLRRGDVAGGAFSLPRIRPPAPGFRPRDPDAYLLPAAQGAAPAHHRLHSHGRGRRRGALFHQAARERGVRLLLLLFLVVSSLVLTWKAHFYYRGSLAQVRDASRYLASKEDHIIYTDHWARLFLRLFSGNRLTRIVQINRDADIEKISGPAYILTGGPRGSLKRFIIWNTLPKRLIEIETNRAPPSKNWEPLRVYPRVKAPITPGTQMLLFQVH